MNRLGRLLAEYRPVGLWAGGVMWLVWLVSSIAGDGCLDLNGQVIGTDHTAFHSAAALIERGRGEALFDFPNLQEFARYQEELTGKDKFLDPFRNPPYYALPYLATARLPYLASYAIWAGISLLALALGLWLIRVRNIVGPLLWSLSFYPVFATISFGQNSLLSLGAFALVYRCLLREQRFLAGLSAGLLLYKPQLLLGLGLWWLLGCRCYWLSLVGLTVAAGSIVLFSALVLPDESRAWVRELPEIAQYDSFEFFNLHNLRGLVKLLTDDKPLGNLFGLVGIGLGAAWLCRFWWRHSKDPSLMMAAAVFATLWGSPHTMIYEWALLVIPGVIIWDRLPEQRATWTCWFAIAWIVLFIATPLTKGQLAVAGVAIQWSVPVLALVAWRVEREFRNSSPISAVFETNSAASPRT